MKKASNLCYINKHKQQKGSQDNVRRKEAQSAQQPLQKQDQFIPLSAELGIQQNAQFLNNNNNNSNNSYNDIFQFSEQVNFQQQQMVQFQPQLENDFNSDDEVDTNIISLNFDFLKNANLNIAMGDPVSCKSCNVVLNVHSKTEDEQQYNKRIEEQKSDQIQIDLKPNERIWVCEFCSHQNVICVEDEEIPKTEDVVYLVESALDEKKGKQGQGQDLSVIFCLDTSGSMQVTQELKNQKMNMNYGMSQEEYDMLKQFIDPGDEAQIYPGHSKNSTYVSRKQCVFAAVEDQIVEMSKEYPDRQVGVVTFNDEVNVIGDGSQQETLVIAGDRLSIYDEIVQATSANSQRLMSQPISKTLDFLKQRLNKAQASGQTALGPALLSALQLAAKGKPGSMIVLCTDGLANKGLGSLESSNLDEKFYDKVCEIAKEHGIIINVITIKGEGCKLDTLGKIVDETSGTVTRITPEEIGKNFAAILKDEIVGFKVELEVQVHKVLKFRNQTDVILSQDKSQFKRFIGNATISTGITFEYEVKNDEELQAINFDLSTLDQVPFQAKIFYTSIDGHRYMRVLTQMQKTTADKREAEKQLEDLQLLHKRVEQQTTYLAQQGNFQKARSYNQHWDHYLQSSNMNANQELQTQNEHFRARNKISNKVVDRKEQKQLKQVQKQQWPTSSSQSSQQQQPILKPQIQKPGIIQSIQNFFKPSSDEPKLPKSRVYEEDDLLDYQSNLQFEQSDLQFDNFQEKNFSGSSDEDEADFMNIRQGKYENISKRK